MLRASPEPNVADRMRRSVVLAFALLAIAGTPAAHAADWGAPFTVTADHSIAGLSAAADPRGGMVVVWQHDTGRAQPPSDGGYGGVESYIRGLCVRPSGSAGVTQTLSITDDLTANPAVAVDGKGGAVAVWTQAYDGHRFTIIAAPRAPAGRFGARQALGMHESLSRRCAQGGDECARRRGRHVGPIGPRGARLHAAPVRTSARRRTLRPAGRCPAPSWFAPTARPRDVDGARKRLRQPAAPGHRFGKPRLLNPGGPGAGGVTAAIGADGTAVVAWLAGDSAFAAVGERGRTVGTAQRLATFYPFSGLGAPAAVVTRAGETLVAWPQGVRNPAGDRTEVAFASRPPGGSFGVQRVLSAPGVRGSAPALATERSGEVVAAWSEAEPVGPAATWWISTTVRPGATSDFPPGRRLAGADGAYRPSALLGADATTQILWRVGDGPLLSARRAG